MPHDRNAAGDKEGNCLRHTYAAFELHRTTMGLLENTCGGMKGLLFRSLIGAEGHIHHDQRLARTARDSASLQDHHVERHRHGRLESVHHIP
jgi:hypothetical protein